MNEDGGKFSPYENKLSTALSAIIYQVQFSLLVCD